MVRPWSPKAAYYWLLDWVNCRLADYILLDTYEHFEYFKAMCGVPARKLIKVSSGADPAIFFPRSKPASAGVFEVEYHGKYIPVQGVDVLIKAAKLLEDKPDIHFTLIGDGQEQVRIRALAHELRLSNVTFLPFMPVERMPEYIAAADVSMGLVGDVPRVRRTIANKVYEAAAMARVSITADTPAVREIFTDGADIVLVKQGDAEALAEAILSLRNDRGKVKKISQSAYSNLF